jgi:hypothetical protein
MNERYELYKAAKWEVEHFHEDCGFNLAEMWDVVNMRSGIESGWWWKNQCLDDYRAKRKD